MFEKILMLILFFNFVINTNGTNPFRELQRLFQNIPEEVYAKREHVKRLPTFYNQREERKKDHSNHLNIQTLNIFAKPNKRQRDEVNLDKFLRTETERICKQTGRCGCNGPRCGDRAEDEAANEVDEVINEINKQLASDKRNKDRDDVTDKEDDVTDKEDDVTDKEDDVINRNLDDDDEQDDEDLLRGEKIKLTDNIDVVVLNPAELDDLLRKKDFIDLTKNSIILDSETGKLASGPNNADHLRDLVADIMKKATSSNENTFSYQNTNKVSPDELFKYYETLKNQITNVFAYYIKNNQNRIPIEENLTDNQLKLLDNLKLIYQQGNLKEKELKLEIVKIVFGDDSDTKILPHTKDSKNIYIPKRFYDDILETKQKKSLRTYKNLILPLTFQQKNRSLTNSKSRIIPKLVWRRNRRHDSQDSGVPFNLEVRGLSQINPSQ